MAKEAFLLSQREYRLTLESRTASLEAELTRLRLEIADTVRTLETRGVSRVDWGDLRRVAAIQPILGLAIGGSPSTVITSRAFWIDTGLTFEGGSSRSEHPVYTRRYGGDAVTGSDVVDVDPANGTATVIADLRRVGRDRPATYDCVILTQTLHLVRRHGGRRLPSAPHPPPWRCPAGDGSQRNQSG